ncbi:MAG: sulfite exporter TauE/SafE family protein [Myxococcota bacterium]
MWRRALLGIAAIAMVGVGSRFELETSTPALVGWFFLGLIASAYGAVIGAGGGFLMVPALLLIGHLPSPQAAGTSLAIVSVSSALASLYAWGQRRIDLRLAMRLALATAPGSILGAAISGSIQGSIFSAAFALLLGAIGLFLLVRPIAPPEADPQRPPRPWWNSALVGAGIGFLSSTLGIGGGVVLVPVLIYWLHFPAAIATATSQLVLTATSMVGASGHLALGHVVPGLALVMGGGAILGARLGTAMAPKVRGPMVVRLLAAGLLLVAGRLFSAT